MRKLIILVFLMGSAMLSIAEPVTLPMAKAAAIVHFNREGYSDLTVTQALQICDTNIARTVIWNHIRLIGGSNGTCHDILIAPVTELEPVILKMDSWAFPIVDDPLSPNWDLNVLYDIATNIRQQLRQKGLYEEDPPPPVIEDEFMPSTFMPLPSSEYPIQGYRTIVDFSTSNVIFEFWVDKKWINENKRSTRLMSVLSGDDAVSLAMAYLLSGGTNPDDLAPNITCKIESFKLNDTVKSYTYAIYGRCSSTDGAWLKVSDFTLLQNIRGIIRPNDFLETNIIVWATSDDSSTGSIVPWLIKYASFDEFILQSVPIVEVLMPSITICISSETSPISGGRLLAAVPDPEFEIVLLSKKSLSDESWTETVAGKVTVPANGKVDVSTELLNLTVKARIVAGDKFFKIKIR